MKRVLIFTLIALLILPFISAINLQIEQQNPTGVMIPELNEPAAFDLKIKNLGTSDNFEFYNLLGFTMTPAEKIAINSGETKDIMIVIYPRESSNIRGYYGLAYYIMASDNSEIEEKLTIRIIDLKDAFEIGSADINPESSSVDLYIYNKENYDFGDVKAKIDSPFFKVEEEFSMPQNQKKIFTIKLNREDYKKLVAGFYTIKADLIVKGKSVHIEKPIKFIEKNIVESTSREYGLFVSTKTITKTNKGNTIAEAEISFTKNIISRLFTGLSPNPDLVERDGLIVTYSWVREVKPGEELNIVVKTNWLMPVLIIIFIVIVVILVRKYSESDLVMRKKVAFVRTKGGEFALKVTISVNAKTYLQRISIRDRIPGNMKIHSAYGPEHPAKVDEKGRVIEWEFNELEAGEKRILTYIIYSKIGVLGKFALPSATAIFDKSGKVKEAGSNRAFFISEQRTNKDLEED